MSRFMSFGPSSLFLCASAVISAVPTSSALAKSTPVFTENAEQPDETRSIYTDIAPIYANRTAIDENDIIIRLDAIPSIADHNDLPLNMRRMLEEAMNSGDSAELTTIVKYLLRSYPDATEDVETIVADFKNEKEEQRIAVIRQASALELWTGKVELGGFRSTGSSSEFGVNTSLSAVRKGLVWTHTLTASADYREANGKTSSERILASYSPTMRLDQRNFLYGLVQYERDPIVGYDYRYTGSFGFGYTILDSDKLMLSATIGPSLRQISYTDDDKETKFGGRSSLNFKWAFTPALSVQQAASAFVESNTASIISRTSLDARIITKLSARFSYNMQYESGSKLTDRSFDTTSRVTLIYDF